MKKNTTKIFIAAIFLTISGTAYAQEGRVGINTSTPAATLDVAASATDLTRTDGFIAPRITGDQLKAKDSNYTTAQDGAIVYVTAVVASTSDKTTNVTSIGYYYFDKTQGANGRWMKIANPSAAAIYQEPWNNVADGTPATSNTASIYQLGKVGIGTNSPLSRLHLGGENTPTLTIRGEGDGNTDSYPQGSIRFLESGATNWGMNINFQSPSLSNSDIYNSIRFQNNDGGTLSDLVTINSYGNVGIGTIHPSNKLHIVSTSNPVKLEGLQTGASADQIVTVDANGVLKKVTSSSLPNSAYQEPWVVQGGTTPATTNSQAISQNASVAIGKSTAYNSTNQTMLDVAGAVRVGINQSGAVGTNSLAIGDGNTASGSASFASGQNTTASGNQSTAVGNAGRASGNGSFAGGYWNLTNGASVAAGQSSFAFGEGANAYKDHSLAFGKDAKANTENGIVMGSYNELPNATNTLFQLANGTSSSSKSNAITVLTDGKTGIGTSSPSQKLDVNGASRLRGQIYDNNNVSGANGQVLSTNSSGQVVWQNNVAITPMAIGVMNNSAPSNAVNSANYNTGAYIDLPAGKWVVNATMLLRKTGSLLENDGVLWIRAGFSTSTTSYIQAGNILSGSLVGPSNYGLMNGIVVINNASGSTQRYYLWRTTSEAFGSATGAAVLDNFAGAWAENQIVATPVN